MENKFKVGDIVYLQKLYTEEEWPDGWSSIPFSFGLNEPLKIEYITLYGLGQSLTIKNHNSVGYYPDIFFDYTPVNSLKQELDKLKKFILNSENRIRLTNKERLIFEKLCDKLDIHICTYNRSISREEKQDLDARFDGNEIDYYDCAKSSISFKDLIEPFKRFKNEVL